jgi:DNA-binding transcriptional regulator YhcF (GntR family)
MRESPDLLPFSLEIRPGQPVFEQLVYAVRKAVISGLIKPGDRFPSVRTLSRELRIHPNTAQKALSALVSEGLLDVHPGVGTVVRHRQPAPNPQSLQLLTENVERLIVDAKKAGVSLEDLSRFLNDQWKQLSHPEKP